MNTFLFLFLSFIGHALTQGVTDPISPEGIAPEGCSKSYEGSFEITVAKVNGGTSKRAACDTNGNLVSTLSDGIIKDALSRVGYIANNFQFQFDGPPQAGAIYTAGFSACTNGSLALGSSAVFYACVSGDFSNLYDRSWAAQCSPVEVLILPCGDSTAPASQIPDGQVIGTQIVTTTVVSALTDGQPQVITKTVPIPLCQITDGQLQVKTTPCASVTAVPVTPTTPVNLPPPVSQFSDGQIQVTSPAAVPTVTSVPIPSPAPATTPAGTTVVPSASASTGSVSTAPASSGTASTLSSLQASTVVSASASASSPATSAPVSSGAGAVSMGSMLAFLVGLAGAMALL